MQIARLIGKTITEIKRENNDLRNISVFDQNGERMFIIVENAAGGNLDAIYDSEGNFFYMEGIE
jgi:hypothetical protein